ncbi:MAG TPA: D-alanyl-D-alanine carboxypeptidase [Dongiaceae bacterium]|nr:D-alanyl-D-alanine carboxypeptidase [Dongiaceae bacterium]
MFILASLFLAPLTSQATPVQANILVDAQTGQVLESHNPDQRTYPASLTKMMTLYCLFEDLKRHKVGLTDQLTFSTNSAGKAATNLNVKNGDRITVETAIYAVIVRSANDVATAVAERLNGSEWSFAKRMTATARRLGMTSTRFDNPSGLPDPDNQTTARDMAILGIALLRDFPQYYHYFSSNSFTYHGVTYTGHNHVMQKYTGADGIKTGYVRLSGFNLVTSAERNGRRLVGVVLGGESPFSRDRQMEAMLDRGFTNPNAAKGETLIAKAPPLSTGPNDGFDVAAAQGGTDEFDIVEQTLQSFSETPASRTAAASVAPVVNKTLKKASRIKTKQPAAQLAAASSYGIQVGAYNRYAHASKAARNARKQLSTLAQNTRVMVDQSGNDSGPVFRAIVAGFTRKAAESACRNLRAKHNACLVVPDVDAVAQRS